VKDEPDDVTMRTHISNTDQVPLGTLVPKTMATIRSFVHDNVVLFHSSASINHLVPDQCRIKTERGEVCVQVTHKEKFKVFIYHSILFADSNEFRQLNKLYTKEALACAVSKTDLEKQLDDMAKSSESNAVRWSALTLRKTQLATQYSQSREALSKRLDDIQLLVQHKQSMLEEFRKDAQFNTYKSLVDIDEIHKIFEQNKLTSDLTTKVGVTTTLLDNLNGSIAGACNEVADVANHFQAELNQTLNIKPTAAPK